MRQPCFKLANYYFLFHIKHKQVGSEREIKNYAELKKKKGQIGCPLHHENCGISKAWTLRGNKQIEVANWKWKKTFERSSVLCSSDLSKTSKSLALCNL